MLALDDLSLSVEPGAIGLVGQNGAGKSTLIKILLGLVRHTAGKVRVYGSDVVKNGVGLRGRIGYMPEREGVVPGLNGIEFVATYFLMLLALFFLGGGRYASVDYWLGRQFMDR